MSHLCVDLLALYFVFQQQLSALGTHDASSGIDTGIESRILSSLKEFVEFFGRLQHTRQYNDRFSLVNYCFSPLLSSTDQSYSLSYPIYGFGLENHQLHKL